MLLHYSHAIVRPPGSSFADGLTTMDLGVPDVALALDQHERYCQALEKCGLTLTRLEPDLRYPDSTFVEDTAVLTAEGAILTRPGAESRRGEVERIRNVLSGLFRSIRTIEPPGTLDAGDVCEAGKTWFIGISQRTNRNGAEQLSLLLREQGFEVVCMEVPEMPGLLHLKSGLSYIGDGRMIAAEPLAGHPALSGYEVIPGSAEEIYATNCVRVNDRVLMPSGFPQLEGSVREMGYDLVRLDMSEFMKMDGGLSCLSLRFNTREMGA